MENSTKIRNSIRDNAFQILKLVNEWQQVYDESVELLEQINEIEKTSNIELYPELIQKLASKNKESKAKKNAILIKNNEILNQTR